MQKAKKNWTLRMAALAFAFTLVSTCLLGGTLARYITTGTGSDSARVAKWGVTITADGNLFSKTYLRHDTSFGTAASLTVESNSAGDNKKLVAPGTGSADIGAGTGLNFGIAGTPEVACKITFAATGSINGWDFDTIAQAAGTDNLYVPVVWSLKNGVGAELCDGTLTDLISKINGLSVNVEPNTDLAAAFDDYVITWSWPFGGNDVGDTYYGDKAAAPTINVGIAITVTQID